MDRLRLMSVFVAVAEAESFAGAARRLGMSPPAVTRALAALEERLGVRLLTRSTRIVRITEAGARYLSDCRRIIVEADEADESVAGLNAAPRGQLTVTAPVLFGRMYVTPIVADYLQRYPEVDVSCWFLDRLVNMVEEGVDVAVRIGELLDSSLQAIRVGEVRRVLCASPAYIAARGVPQHPRDLAAHVIVSASAVTPMPEWRLRDADAMRAYKLHPRMTTTTNDSAIAAVAGGFGLTCLLSYQVAQHLDSGTLTTVLEAYEPAPIPVHVVHREGARGSRKVRAFIDIAIDRLRADPALSGRAHKGVTTPKAPRYRKTSVRSR